MNALSRFGAAAMIAIIASGAAWRVHLAHLESAQREANGAKPALLATSKGTARWTRGQEYRYDARWESHGALTIAQLGAGAPMMGDARLEGELVVRALGDDGPGELLEVSFVRIGVHSLRIGAHDALSDEAATAATFGGEHAFAKVGEDGAIAEVRYRSSAPAIFRRLMDRVVSSLGVTIPASAGATWTAEERGPNGRAQVMYEVEGEHMTRTRVRYTTLRDFPGGVCDACAQTLRSRGAIAFAERGGLDALDDSETLDARAPTGDRLVASSETHLHLIAVSTFGGDPVDTTGLEANPEGFAALDPNERRDLDAAAAGTMSAGDLDALVDRIVRSGVPIAERGWLARAAGYLRIHPEAIAALRDRALAGKTNERDAALVLLAAAGNEDAQRAMRAVVARSMAADAPADAARFIQRFTIVSHPDRASGDFLRNAYVTSRKSKGGDVAHGAAAALGAVAGRLARDGEREASRELAQLLEGDLARATSPDDKRALVLGLGNVHDEEDAARVRPFANDTNAAVRAEVAWSLRDASSAESRAILLALLADAQPSVAALALRTLDRQAPDDALVSAIADRVVSGAVSIGIDGALVDFFAGHVQDRIDTARALAAVLARAEDPELRGRIRALLAELT